MPKKKTKPAHNMKIKKLVNYNTNSVVLVIRMRNTTTFDAEFTHAEALYLYKSLGTVLKEMDN